MTLSAKSTILSSLFFGENPMLDWITPWKIEIDHEMETVTVSKRNYYLIGVDKDVIPYRNIRRVTLDTHLFGADISLKVYGTGLITAKCLKKSEAREIYNACLEEISSNRKSKRFS